jgi:predicted dehydrogenase
MNIAVIGCGSIGKRHMKNILGLGEGHQIKAYDARPDRREEVRGNFPEVDVVDTSKGLFGNSEIAFICVPTAYHLEAVQAAIEAGCHIFMEKPISHSMNGVKEFLKVCEDRRLTVAVGYNLRFHPGILMCKKILDEERIGKVYSVRAEFGQYLPDWHPWERYQDFYMSKLTMGGGVLLDATHDIDYLHWFFGEIEEVAGYCLKSSNLEIESDDLVEAIVRFKSGLRGSIHLDLIQRMPRREFVAIGERGTLLWSHTENQVKLFEVGNDQWEIFPYQFNPNQTYVNEIKDFLSAVKEGREPAVPGRKAYHCLEVAEAIRHSAEHMRFVRVPVQ